MRNVMVVIVLAATLAGCQSAAELQAEANAQAARDHQECLSYGAWPGTPIYTQCRMNITTQRRNQAAAAQAAAAPVICHRVFTTTICQ